MGPGGRRFRTCGRFRPPVSATSGRLRVTVESSSRPMMRRRGLSGSGGSVFATLGRRDIGGVFGGFPGLEVRSIGPRRPFRGADDERLGETELVGTGREWAGALTLRAGRPRCADVVDFFAGANHHHVAHCDHRSDRRFARSEHSPACAAASVRREAGLMRDRRTEAAPPIRRRPLCEVARLRVAKVNGTRRRTVP